MEQTRNNNKYLRLAAILFVLTLITMSLVGGTFAKYVSSGTSENSARVAKWGVTVAGSSTNSNALFAADYTANGIKASGSSDASVATSANGTDKIVYPGYSEEISFGISGTPEVATKVTFDGDFALSGWTIPSGATTAAYCPLVITVTNGSTATEYKVDGTTITDAAGLAAAVNTALDGIVSENAPNTDLSKTVKVKIEWPFSVDDATDLKDTALGNLATAPTVQANLDVKVEQINAFTAA